MNATGQDGFGPAREFVNRTGVRVTVHVLEHLQQTPSLILVALRVQDAFSLEVYVIDQGIASLWRSHEAFKLLLHVRSVGRRRFGQHLRQSILQSGNKKFCLQVDGVGQEPA